jgi:hypothetical protein
MRDNLSQVGFYPVNHRHTSDDIRWRTEIGWPIFETAPR